MFLIFKFDFVKNGFSNPRFVTNSLNIGSNEDLSLFGNNLSKNDFGKYQNQYGI